MCSLRPARKGREGRTAATPTVARTTTTAARRRRRRPRGTRVGGSQRSPRADCDAAALSAAADVSRARLEQKILTRV